MGRTDGGPENGDSGTEQDRFADYPQKADVLPSVAGMHLAQKKRTDHPQLDRKRLPETGRRRIMLQ